MELVKDAEIEGMHFVHALLIGVVAGVVLVFLDNYLLTKVETMAGLQPLAA